MRLITPAYYILLSAVYALTFIASAHAQGAGKPTSLNEQRIKWQDVSLLNGTTIKAEQLNRDTVIVQFWATWCPFCARQNPNIEALHRAAAGRYRVLTFSIDQVPQTVIDYQRAKGYSFDVAMSPVRGNDIFGKRLGLPEVIVIKPGGVVAIRIPGEMFEEDVRELPTKYGDVK